jgi:transcriptional regulator with XRE-family HTH domain
MTLRIKELRSAAGWTQEELAARANISRSQLAMIEKGSRPANTIRLTNIAKALGVTVEQLFPPAAGQADLMTVFRRLSAADQQIVLSLAESLAAKAAKAE